MLRPLRRSYVNKGKSSADFRRKTRRTKSANIGLARGGIRL